MCGSRGGRQNWWPLLLQCSRRKPVQDSSSHRGLQHSVSEILCFVEIFPGHLPGGKKKSLFLGLPGLHQALLEPSMCCAGCLQGRAGGLLCHSGRLGRMKRKTGTAGELQPPRPQQGRGADGTTSLPSGPPQRFICIQPFLHGPLKAQMGFLESRNLEAEEVPWKQSRSSKEMFVFIEYSSF